MSYVGMATNIIGGELQGWAAALARQEMYRQYLAELTRQRGSRNEALGAFNSGVQKAGVETAREDMAQGQERREGAYNRIAAVPMAQGPSQRSTSGQKIDQAQGQLMGKNRAKLGSYGDWDLATTLRQIDTARKLNQISNFAGGNAQVFPYRMYDAQHSQDTMAMIGQAISSIGGGGVNFSQFNQTPGGGGGGGVSGGYGSGSMLKIDPETGMAIEPFMLA